MRASTIAVVAECLGLVGKCSDIHIERILKITQKKKILNITAHILQRALSM